MGLNGGKGDMRFILNNKTISETLIQFRLLFKECPKNINEFAVLIAYDFVFLVFPSIPFSASLSPFL